MRVSDILCTCDQCHTVLNPFEVIKIKRSITVPGKNYPKVSSDVTTKSRKMFDLCRDCYIEKFGPIIEME